MNETKHTAEPWHTIEGGDRQWLLHSESVSHLATMGTPGEANARRIVACVNACAGIPIEVLTAPEYSIKAELDTLDEQIARRLNAEEERNRLYARLLSLEEVATGVDADIDAGRPREYNVEHLRDELVRAREALGILPEQDAVGPKEDHAAQYPGQLFDLDEIKKGSPVGQCRCLIHPVPPGLEMLSPEELADGAAVDCQRSVPEKVINKIAQMYAYDLQTAYEKGLKDE